MMRFVHYRPGGLARILMVAGLVIGLAVSSVPPSQAAEDNLSAAQQKQVEELVRKYIVDHPEVIVEAIQRMQAREQEAQKVRAQAALKDNHLALVADADAPIMGNPNGKVTVVEFFDYRCGYCKRVFPTIMQILKNDPSVRYVVKEFPILGPESVTASRASLAVWRTHKDKYKAFHAALMTARGGVPEAKVLHIAEGLGIDKGQLKKAMADPAIDKILERNYSLAQALNINGTPAFVIGGKLVPGAIDAATMKKMIAEAGS